MVSLKLFGKQLSKLLVSIARHFKTKSELFKVFKTCVSLAKPNNLNIGIRKSTNRKVKNMYNKF